MLNYSVGGFIGWMWWRHLTVGKWTNMIGKDVGRRI
jgi:hypothetical protein